ncbi:putative pre-mRNA-splicing factor 38 [Helianthus annuus]|nr:putative pre-mRNA-splicing factor 38 [Helianthus annuus]
MANRTDPSAKSIRGTNPQNLVEKILRSKIYQNTYWKEQCFGLTAETLVDKAMELDHVGGTHGGNRKPTPFICLVMKMLQIQPDKEIVVEFIKNEDYKYVRVLGAFYLRLTGTDIDVYRYLEPLYNDYRKLRRKLADGHFALTHVDEVIDELLTKDYSCDIALPRIKKRLTIEAIGALEPRKSALEDDFEEEEEKDEDEQLMDIDAGGHEKDYYRRPSPSRERDRDRDRDRDRKRDSHRHRDRDYDREYDRDYERDRRDRDRDRDRDLDRDRDRYRGRDNRDYGRERDRRDRDRGGRRRSRSRSPSRERDRDRDERRQRHARDSSTSPSRRGAAEGEKPPAAKKKKEKEKKDDGTDHPDPEIAEANRIRASLGLKPLRL